MLNGINGYLLSIMNGKETEGASTTQEVTKTGSNGFSNIVKDMEQKNGGNGQYAEDGMSEVVTQDDIAFAEINELMSQKDTINDKISNISLQIEQLDPQKDKDKIQEMHKEQIELIKQAEKIDTHIETKKQAIEDEFELINKVLNEDIKSSYKKFS